MFGYVKPTELRVSLLDATPSARASPRQTIGGSKYSIAYYENLPSQRSLVIPHHAEKPRIERKQRINEIRIQSSAGHVSRLRRRTYCRELRPTDRPPTPIPTRSSSTLELKLNKTRKQLLEQHKAFESEDSRKHEETRCDAAHPAYPTYHSFGNPENLEDRNFEVLHGVEKQNMGLTGIWCLFWVGNCWLRRRKISRQILWSDGLIRPDWLQIFYTQRSPLCFAYFSNVKSDEDTTMGHQSQKWC